MLLPIMLLAAAAVAQPTGLPTAETEMLGATVPDEFVVGHQARNQTQQIVELVRPPETVHTWTSLITLQMFFGGARIESADDFYAGWRSRMRNSCPGMTDSFVKGTVDGMPAIRGTLSCPKNPQTGKPENLGAVLVQGKVNLMMVQVAFRHSIGPADLALIDSVTRSLKVCDWRAMPACTARKATGFIASGK